MRYGEDGGDFQDMISSERSLEMDENEHDPVTQDDETGTRRADIFRHKPSTSSAPVFVEEDAVNPFEMDLYTSSFASEGDACEKDFYKPLPVADQMGQFARFPTLYNTPLDDLPTAIGTVVYDNHHEPPSTEKLQQRTSENALDIEAQDKSIAQDQETVGIPNVVKEMQNPKVSNESLPIVEASDSSGIFVDSSRPGKNKAKPTSRSVLTAGLESLKYFYSLTLLVFCVVLVTGTIFTNQTASTAGGFSPIAAFFIFWFLILWLAMMEGGQGALVGLQSIDRQRYRATHTRTYKNTRFLDQENGLERFIVGRQFLVVLVVFLSQLMSSAIPNVTLWDLGDSVTAIFLDSGVALMVVTIVLGQLLAQLNAAKCMLDFINNYFMLYFVTFLSLFIEFSGLLHSVYLVQMLFSKIGGNVKNQSDREENPRSEKNTPRSLLRSVFFWARVLFSSAVLGFAFAVTLSALFRGQTTMWQSVPKTLSVILFFSLMCFVGMMEGMQIAFFAVMKYPEEELAKHKVAHKNCSLTFRGENLQSFLIGRQICVTMCTFLIARITTLDVEIGVDDNIFGVSDGVQTFFNTGLLGAVITTIISSLSWRIIASSFPIAFLSNPLVNVIVHICLLLEASGVCSSAWVLARYQKILARYQRDEVYLEDNSEIPSTQLSSTRDKDIDRFVMVLRFTCSLVLFTLSVVLLMASIFTGQTITTAEADDWVYPTVTFFVFWFLILWLAVVEGGLGCLMGLKNIDESKFMLSHKHASENAEIVYKGDNLQRFIVGRQFLVVVIIFICTWLTESVEDASVLGLPEIVNKIFLSGDLALVLIIIIAGQLTAEVNAASCMLDFVNNCFTLYFVTYLSLAVEFSGLLHSVYLVQMIFSKISGKKIESGEPQRSMLQQIFFWGRVLCSLSILGFAFAVTLAALIAGNASLWEHLPNASSITIIIALICLVGMMEGLQIALFGLTGIPEEDLARHRIAFANFNLAVSGENLRAFFIGRQICVTSVFVLIARMSTLNVVVGVDENIFGVSDGVQEFFNSGVFGALLTTIMASLIWRLFASSFPVTFMSNPIIYVVIWLCLLVEASGICSACWVFARWMKLALGYQPDEVYLEGAPKHGVKPVTRRDKNVDVTSSVIRYIFSSTLLCFGIAVTMSLVFTEQTELSSTIHPGFVFAIFWFLLFYLATMEGGQGCLVGLQGIDEKKYKKTHRIALKNTEIAHNGNNMQRFIVGRQFLVVLVVFIINLCGSPLPGSDVFQLPNVVSTVFVDSGVSLILITVILGQLTAQVNAASCMLDFINSYFMLYFVTYISMAIEMSGILHCVYLVQILFSKITGTQIQTNEPSPTRLQRVFFWGRAMISLVILGFAFAVTLSALFEGKTTSWKGIPGAVSVIVFFLLMCIAGLMEGMQIALFAVVNLPEEELSKHKTAEASYKLAFTGKNLQAFLIGRQIFVTLCTFVIARLTTLDVEVGADENIFGVPDGVQTFFNTGLLGAIITTVVGSLAWRIIAASFPIAFLSNPLVYVILRLCLILEASGICSAAWLLALINKQMIGYQSDTVYIGTTEPAKHAHETSSNNDTEDEPIHSVEMIESKEMSV